MAGTRNACCLWFQGKAIDKGEICQLWLGKGCQALHCILPYLDLFHQGLPIDISVGGTGPRTVSSKQMFLEEHWTKKSSLGSTSILLCVLG